jgi:inactive dipeptidyl peptidase 10
LQQAVCSVQRRVIIKVLITLRHSYGGPGSQLVTERWKLDWNTYLASKRDFIVAQIDGRGSGGQGQKLLHEVYHRLGTVEVKDQLEVTE